VKDYINATPPTNHYSWQIKSMGSTEQVQQWNKLNDALGLMQLEDSVLVLTREIIFNFFFIVPKL